ncbi:MAG: ABC transporter permease [Candidatus Zixiibacteriota bacterium]|nr:MAG: ABC transporter permease [candidate division Zixibacteria bacterium]
MIILKIAFRNIFRQKRRTLLTALTIFGGFTLAAISIGWSEGTYSYTIDMFTRNQMGHIQIHGKGYLDKPTLYNTINNYRQIGETISGLEGLEGWCPRLYSSGLAAVAEKSAGAIIIGIDPALENEATGFDKKVAEGKSFSKDPAHEAILGSGLMDILNADIGDSAVIVSQAADGSIANDIYEIVGIVESGDNLSDRSSFYLHLSDAQELFVLDQRVHEIAIISEELGDVDELVVRIKSAVGESGLSIEPWQEFAKQFYVAMQADKQGAWIMIFIIILIVAVGVLNTVLMTVLERIREYGVLRALGTRPIQIFRLIILETNFIAVGSILVGLVASTIINYLLSIKGISMPDSITYGGVEFTKMYSEVNAISLYIPAITVIVTVSLVSVFPAIKAARTSPSKAMRIH